MNKPASKRNKLLYCFISYLSAMIVFSFFIIGTTKKAYPDYFEGALNTGFVFTLLLRIVLIIIIALAAKEKEGPKQKTNRFAYLLTALVLTFLISAINDSIILKTTSDYAGSHKYSFEFKGLAIFINICEYLLFVLGIVGICLLKNEANIGKAKTIGIFLIIGYMVLNLLGLFPITKTFGYSITFIDIFIPIINMVAYGIIIPCFSSSDDEIDLEDYLKNNNKFE